MSLFHKTITFKLFIALAVSLTTNVSFAESLILDPAVKQDLIENDGEGFAWLAASALPLELEACAILYPKLDKKVGHIWSNYPVTSTQHRQTNLQCINKEFALTQAQCEKLISMQERTTDDISKENLKSYKKLVIDGLPLISDCI